MTAYIPAAIPMTKSSPPGPRRKPKQERARQLVAAIEQACARILEEEGPERLTTNRIAEVAGVNIGSLYQYFPNKEAIVAAVYAAKVADEAEALVLIACDIRKLARQSLEDALRAIIRHEIEAHRRLSQLHEHFYGRYHLTFDLLTAATERSLAHGLGSMWTWFPTVLHRHRARLRVADLSKASFLATSALHGVMRFVIEKRPDLLDDPAFEQDLLDLVLRYLEANPASEEAEARGTVSSSRSPTGLGMRASRI